MRTALSLMPEGISLSSSLRTRARASALAAGRNGVFEVVGDAVGSEGAGFVQEFLGGARGLNRLRYRGFWKVERGLTVEHSTAEDVFGCHGWEWYLDCRGVDNSERKAFEGSVQS